MISEQLVRLGQAVHLSCTDSNTVSKEKEVRFHKTHVTYEFHWVRPKWFLSLWYIRRKPCTYLPSRLALSSKGPKRDCTWASSPSGTIMCVQNDFWAYGTSRANHALISHQQERFHTERREIPHDPRHVGVPSGASKMIFELMLCLTQTVHLLCVKISTISKQTQLLLVPHHLEVRSGPSKMSFGPMVCLAQTVHLSCTDTNIISKWIEVRFHMTHIT
jgi:hypothetical protein